MRTGLGARVSKGMGVATADGAKCHRVGKCNLTGVLVANGATAKWFKFYDKATAPASADTPLFSIYMPANTSQMFLLPNVQINLGIGSRESVNAVDNDATYTSFAANDCAVNVFYDK